jgi:hypothetical protein
VPAAIALAAIMCLGAAVRFWGIRFGLPHTASRPDEEFVVAVALGFFSGDYNPHFFQWPSLFFYLAHGVAWLGYLASRVLGDHSDLEAFLRSVHADPAWFYISIRVLSAACGVATIAAVYSLARTLFDRATALAAAFFLSLAYLHVRDSHFGVLDVTVTLFVVLTARLLADAWQRDAPRSRFVLAGICAGLAASIKYNAAAVAAVAVVVVAMRLVTRAGERPNAAAGDVAAFALAFAGCFLAGTPYAWLDARAFLAGVREQSLHFTEGHGIRIGNGWLHHLTFSLRYGLGLPLLLAGLGGLAAASLTAPRKAIVLGTFPLLYFGVIGAGQTAFVRYVVPLLPFLCIAAGFGVTRLGGRFVTGRFARWRPGLAAAAAAVILIPSVVNVLRFDRIISRVDTRVLAAQWLGERMAPGSVLYESGASYAQPHVAWAVSKRDYVRVEFDTAKDRFTAPGAGLPDWAVVVADSSPRLYSRTPFQVTAILAKEYDLVQEFKAVRGRERESWFDRQDAFFLPFSNLSLRERPGPDLRIYRRR